MDVRDGWGCASARPVPFTSLCLAHAALSACTNMTYRPTTQRGRGGGFVMADAGRRTQDWQRSRLEYSISGGVHTRGRFLEVVFRCVPCCEDFKLKWVTWRAAGSDGSERCGGSRHQRRQRDPAPPGGRLALRGAVHAPCWTSALTKKSSVRRNAGSSQFSQKEQNERVALSRLCLH